MQNIETEIVAERHLDLNGNSGVVTATLFRPKWDGQDYYCQYKISGLSISVGGLAFGVDSVQALVHGLNSLGAAIYFCDEYKSGSLKWGDGPENGSMGIPVASSIAQMVPPSDV